METDPPVAPPVAKLVLLHDVAPVEDQVSIADCPEIIGPLFVSVAVTAFGSSVVSPGSVQPLSAISMSPSESFEIPSEHCVVVTVTVSASVATPAPS